MLPNGLDRRCSNSLISRNERDMERESRSRDNTIRHIWNNVSWDLSNRLRNLHVDWNRDDGCIVATEFPTQTIKGDPGQLSLFDKIANFYQRNDRQIDRVSGSSRLIESLAGARR